MAMACQWPLQEFLSKIAQYESSLGHYAKLHPLQRAGQSARWAIYVEGEAEKLRAVVAAKHISINLLLALQTS